MSQYLDSAKQSINNAVSSIPGRDQLTANASIATASAQASLENAKASISNTLEDFSSKNVMNASTEFLISNSTIAKFGFLILLLIVFLLLLRIGVAIIAYLMSPPKQPYLAKGITSGNSSLTITQDPAVTTSAVVYKSNNQTGGIEFTWSTWLWIDSIDTTAYKRVHIFNKGNDEYNPNDQSNSPTTKSGLATVNNGPGLYLGVDAYGKSTNSLVFYLDAENTSSPLFPISLEITNIPLKKWFHVAYRFQNYTIDCYMNGVLAKSAQFLDAVPKQNFDDVHIGKNSGFSGRLSNLRYYDYALSAFDINTITNYGPNLAANSQETQNNTMFDYIGMGWYSAFR